MADIKIVNHIQEYDNMIGAETLHPLVNVVDFSKLPPIRNFKMHRLFGYYAIYLKGAQSAKIHYGRSIYQYKEGALVFFAPGQVAGAEDDGKYHKITGYVLMFHPDLLKGTALSQLMKQYSYFSYDINEALLPTEDEKAILIDCFERIEKELRYKDRCSISIVIDYIKSLGFKYSTLAGITFSVADVQVPATKKDILAEADKQVEKVRNQYRRGLITDDERYQTVVGIWEKATNDVSKAMEENFGDLNPIYMMVKSGARGNMNQLRQIAGMRGLMASTTGKAVEIPIKSCFREGLDALEYFISSHGARKGLSDTALRTADSGYLTRRLVDVSQDIIVREHDCETNEGLMLEDIKDGNQIVEGLEERLEGRYPLNDITNPETGELIVDKNTMINKVIAKEIVAAGIKQVVVRSVIGCRSKHGVCQKCYGMGLARRELVSIGESVGIIAAQSIGEPGTQLTMRTIHSGGVAGVADITQGLPRVEEIFEARKPKGVAVITEIDGKVKISESKKKLEIIVTSSDDSRTYTIPFGSKLKVKDGDEVKAAQPLIEGSINPAEILAIKGPEGVYEYVISEIQKAYRSQGVDINDKHIEVIARQMLRKMRVDDGGDTDMFPGSLVDMYEFEDKNKEVVAEGKRPATGKRALLGITKASLATDSFLSAASFQETTRVLTEAAIKGKEDHLIGLKENVIIGKLIPAGTGMKRYQDVKIKVDGEDEETIAKKEYSMKDDDSSEQEAE